MLFEEIVKKNSSFLLNNKMHDPKVFKTPDLENEIITIFNNLTEDASWSFENLSRKETSYATHGYHRYPAKFIPQLARRCIEDYSTEGEIVCDPFMGCGTTLVEALISGRKAVGVDINPVAWLITKAKAVPIEPEKLKKEINKILSDISAFIEFKKNKIKPLKEIDIEPTIPDNERIKYWFPHDYIREELGIILGRINRIEDLEIRNFCLCAFSQILKNCSVWLMKSVKPTRDLKKKPADPFQAFKKHINYMVRGNEELFKLMPEHVKRSLDKYLIAERRDARDLPCKSNSVSLIVTSPPYVTSYEYADLHQLTALWLGYTKNVIEFREGFIGSIYKRTAIYDGIKSEIAKKEIKELEKKSKREAEAVRNYFFEMQQCFEEMHRILKHGGKACIVIGNTELKKVKILNAEVFVEIMLNIGFGIHKIIKRRIPSKTLPSTRDSKTGRFTSNHKADRLAYAYEYILIMEKL
ncbi:MAG: site-specific DNA-methyltransferase [Candidatus Diapherotrites archaeon]|nr:site-specific DNA-methyltransferase [Candidatus Diapherotrites archaeon]